MSKWILAAGAAALALATPALAGPDGKGGGDRGPKAGKVERGGGNARVESRGERPDKGAAKAEARGRLDDRVMGKSADRRLELRGKDDMKARKSDRLADRGSIDKAQAKAQAKARKLDRDDDDFFDRDDRARDGRGLVNGCPPGLAAKNNGCLPPGQAKKLVGAILPAAFGANMLDGPFRQWYQDNDQYYYRNDGANIFRVNRDGGLIDALIPYGARDNNFYPVGMNYPGEYDFYNVPDQYRSFYADGSDYDYRFGNNAIYQVDPQTNAIQSIVALLAGDLSVGQQMPSNYSMYNVPLAYRDRYYDSPDAMYRYNDGYIYRADPQTQLITAVIDAIV